VNFSLGFLVVYLLVSFVLFGRIPLPAPILESLHGLMILGFVPCLGYCLFRHSAGKTVGILAFYLFLFLAVTLLVSGPATRESFVAWIMTSRMIFVLGFLLIVGYALMGYLSFREFVGGVLLYLVATGFVLAMILLTYGPDMVAVVLGIN